MSQPVVLVTGGSGLIGSALQRLPGKPHGRWVFASSRDGDLTKRECAEALVQQVRPTHVVHLAACVGGLFRNLDSNVEMFEANMAINHNVLAAIDGLPDPCTAVLCLSTCVFPDAVARYPFDEASLHDGPPHESNQGYAYAKRMMEVEARLRNDANRKAGRATRFVCVTPTNVYGPCDNFHLHNGHVLPALIHRAFLAEKSGQAMPVRGDGSPLRQFVYADDVARCMCAVLFDSEASDKFPHGIIIAHEHEHSIREVAHAIAKEFGLDQSSVQFEMSPEQRVNGQQRKTASSQLLQLHYPECYANFTPLYEGVARTVQWFRENHANARL